MLLNISNHPSTFWPTDQYAAAIDQYESVEDMDFPDIDPALDSDDLDQLVDAYERLIKEIDPTAIHLMGELTFTYRLVRRLKEAGYHVIASTTQRISQMVNAEHKVSTFRFVRFRPY
jgi:hypothetical protein